MLPEPEVQGPVQQWCHVNSIYPWWDMMRIALKLCDLSQKNRNENKQTKNSQKHNSSLIVRKTYEFQLNAWLQNAWLLKSVRSSETKKRNYYSQEEHKEPWILNVMSYPGCNLGKEKEKEN